MDGQWNVWLDIRSSEDSAGTYISLLQFNVSSSTTDEDYGFSVYKKKEDKSPERFSGMPGFQPEYVSGIGLISVEGSNVIHIWFDDHPEYIFVVNLSKNDDGKRIGTGAASSAQEDETAATIQMIQTVKWNLVK